MIMKTQSKMLLPKKRVPIHPGEILKEEFMVPLNISQQSMAKYLKVSRKHVSDIVNCKKSVSLEIAQRLAKVFETSIELWIQGQLVYDIWMAQKNPSSTLRTIQKFKKR